MTSDVGVSGNVPARHESGSFVLDLDLTSLLISRVRCMLHAPRAALSGQAGQPALGLIVSLLDLAAAEPALAACRPAWIATQDLTVHATRWLVDGPAVVDAHIVRAGKKSITVAANVYDGHGVQDFDLLRRGIDAGDARGPTLTARGLLTFARIRGSSTDMHDYDPGSWLGKVRRRTFDRPPVDTLQARMGLEVVDAAAGVVELPRTRYVMNSIGTIFGGAQATLFQMAAEAMRPGLVATDLQVHYLSQLKRGPARTLGTVSRDSADHSVVSLRLMDAGHGDQLVALATVTLQRPPG